MRPSGSMTGRGCGVRLPGGGSIRSMLPRRSAWSLPRSPRMCARRALRTGATGERMDGAAEGLEREKWNQRYLEGTHGTLPPDALLIQAFERYIEPLFPHAG